MKRLFYILGIIVLLLVGIGVIQEIIIDQNRARQIQSAAEVDQKIAARKQLTDCLDAAGRAYSDALTPEKTDKLPPQIATSYLQTALQIHQSHIAECQARYAGQ